jgi:proline iminopeptidase
MRDLYPSSQPYITHTIIVDKKHNIYVEECGNPQGYPVVFLHGGPGTGCCTAHRRYFDPDFFRIILFDQRGSGKSVPLGETNQNRTPDLVSDMDVIRGQLGIEQWLLFGGSWGATLALIYSLSYPDRVSGMILRGTFLAREPDLEWFFIGLQRLLPQYWQQFVRDLPKNIGLRELINRYHAAVHTGDRNAALQAAASWSGWGGRVVGWRQSQIHHSQDKIPAAKERQERLLAKVKIETHYARHCYFLKENEILRRIGSLSSMPVSIVHGRYDLVCTMDASWRLHRAIPGSRFVQLPNAGHLIDDPAMLSALIEETDRMRELL